MKERKTAEQLSDMIASAMGVAEVHVNVRRDHAYGWQPTNVSSPGRHDWVSKAVEQIASRLRFQFAEGMM